MHRPPLLPPKPWRYRIFPPPASSTSIHSGAPAYVTDDIFDGPDRHGAALKTRENTFSAPLPARPTGEHYDVSADHAESHAAGTWPVSQTGSRRAGWRCLYGNSPRRTAPSAVADTQAPGFAVPGGRGQWRVCQDVAARRQPA